MPASIAMQRRKARSGYKRAVARSKPGQGARFKALARSAAAGGARNPNAVAAGIGRRKYGAKQMAKWARAGRKRAA